MSLRTLWAAIFVVPVALSSVALGESPPLILQKVVEQMDPAPGFEDVGFLFEALGHHPTVAAGVGFQVPPRIDNVGNVSFHACVNEDGVPGDTHPFCPHRGFFRMVDGQLELVVKVGDPAPGVNAAFAGFVGPDIFPVGSTPMMHDGAITFGASATDNFNRGLWSDRFGTIEFILRVGDTALPGTPVGQVVRDFAAALGGTTIVVNARTSTEFANLGLWRNADGTFERIVNRGAFAPGTEPGVFFDDFTSLAFFGPVRFWDVNVHGEIIFNAYLGRARAVCGNGVCEPFDGENCLTCPQDCAGKQGGNPAQRYCCGNGGGENPVGCDDPRCTSPSLDCEAQPSVDIHVHNDEGIWVNSPTTGGQLIVREGDSAPQVSPDAVFGSMSPTGTGGLTTFGDEDDIPVRINDHGAILFGARVTTPEYFSKSSIWTTRHGELELIATGSRGLPEVPNGPHNQFPGDVAPGFDGRHATFQRFIFGDLSNTGDIAFIGQVIFDDDPLDVAAGIWWDVSGELTLVAAVGEPVPPVPGAVFTNLQYIVNVNRNWRHTLFLGAYSGPGVPAAVGLFRANPNGSVDLLLTHGDTVVIDDVDERVVESFVIGLGQSDVGKRAFLMTFTDGTSGIYVASLAPTPTLLGDMNCDGVVDGLDIAPFVLALLDPAAYLVAHATCDLNSGDFNADALVNEADVVLFVQCLLDGCP